MGLVFKGQVESASHVLGQAVIVGIHLGQSRHETAGLHWMVESGGR